MKSPKSKGQELPGAGISYTVDSVRMLPDNYFKTPLASQQGVGRYVVTVHWGALFRGKIDRVEKIGTCGSPML